jgi:hypothetical protein
MAPLPRDFGYVLRLVPWHAAPLANQMRLLLAKPEMAEIIAANPRLQRLLRPLCHMLGIETDGLMPPPPPPRPERMPEPPGTVGEAPTDLVPLPAGATLVELRAAGPPGERSLKTA